MIRSRGRTTTRKDLPGPHRASGPGSSRVLPPFLLFSLAGCKAALLDPQGPVGAAEKSILLGSVAIMLAIVVPTILATLGFAWWFRASNDRARYRPDWAFSGQLELVTWSVPLLTIMLLGGVAWIGAHRLDPFRPLASTEKPLEVQVVSLDWKWLFLYPAQGVASLNELTVPAGVPVHFTLTSASVMNAFFVPQLGGMIYTMNGMTTELHLMADNPGTFRGMSSHFSGDGFSGMRFEVRALPPERFEAWAAAARNSADALDAARYRTLTKQSLDDAPATFRDADPALFQRIVSQREPPGPGPAFGQTGKPGPDVSPKPASPKSVSSGTTPPRTEN